MPISAPLPPRDHQNKREFPIARRWTVVHEPASPHRNAVHYGGRPFTEQDWDLGPTIWRCALCEYQWYTVDDLEHRDEGVICPQCNNPLSKFDRPSLYRAPAKQLAKSPPASYLNYLPRVPFAPIAGPDEASMVSVHTELSGPLYNQREDWHLDCMFPLS